MKLTCSRSKPPLGGLITAEYAKMIQNKPVTIEWADETSVSNCSSTFALESSTDVARAVARFLAENELYGTNPLEKTEVDHWLTFSAGPLQSNAEFSSALLHLNKTLAPLTFLVGKRITIADFIVFAALYTNKNWLELLSKRQTPPHVLRWYNFIKSQEVVVKTLQSIPDEVKLVPSSSRQSVEKTVDGRKQEGKFVELPGAEMGKVVVRFPPEASGYLHIGHAKAALLNQYYQQAFQGKLIMRFDDTNPAKENVHFEQVILEDVAMLEIKYDLFTHTSQYFDLMLELCEKMIKEGKAYVDDTEAELMKQQREQKIESANRNNSTEKNLQLWEEMKQATEKGQQCCVRAKIDMQSPNGCMRDPTIYRCKNEPHPRTGTKYKVYPTYDFACPIVDSIEGVTHVLRTMEYHDRDPQFYWFIDVLGLRKPIIWEYSRLSMTNTVLSKRKLTWFVQQKLVDGWDDPRFPTVRGVLRRGMTVEGLRQFIIAQGSSRSVVFMEWDKIWAFNKKVIDPIAPRYTALEYDSPVPVLVKDVKEEMLTVPRHPKNPDVGNKEIWIGPRIFIDRVDAGELKEGENATFINWGNLLIKKINRENGKITNVEAEPNLDNKDYKKTLKLTWLADTKKAPFTPTWCVYFDHIISKPVLAKDEDFKQYVNKNTRKEVQMLGDPELKKLKKGDIIQIQRRGFFKVDVAYEPHSLVTSKETPVVLFYVPDGHTKENPAISTSTKESVKKEKAPTVPTFSGKSADQINEEIIIQGDLVRNLKSQKSEKSKIDEAVKVLLALKVEYKNLTGSDWKPGSSPPATVGSANADELSKKISGQGDKVRKLKSEKAEKSAVDAEVKTLLELKAEYKKATGKDWTPTSTVSTPSGQNASNTTELLHQIAAQGDKVRDLKQKKADKSVVDQEVKILLELKADYKKLTGQDWKPDLLSKESKPIQPPKSSSSEAEVLKKITEQGDKVRDLKQKKAEKTVIDAEVKVLLDLKAQYKAVTGQDWKPGVVAKQVVQVIDLPPSEGVDFIKDALTEKVNEQGNIVRDLKAKKASKEEIDAAVKKLLELKAEYKEKTGTDFPAPGKTSSKPKEQKVAAPKEKVSKQRAAVKEKKPVEVDDGGLKKQTRLGLESKKEENLSEWYSEVITKGEMIEYYDVSGCYIFRPWAYGIWEAIQSWFDAEIKKLGVKNCYFPMFVSRSVLEKEKTHIADFAPEVAWVTKSGDSDLAEPIAIRPTSETVMYPAYAKWIRSYRDLPLKFNQWNNVVRWEFKHPQPFIRTREFLWQEGHTAYATKAEADLEVTTILDLYARIYTDLLAVPVVKGRKTEKEKFAGGDYTLTTEAFISASGRGVQGATSHHLGQNFSKMFEIVYEHPKTREKEYVYQNSWGLTTRTIGVMILVHADNQGLVLPPRIASVQAVIVPCGITADLSDSAQDQLLGACSILEDELKLSGVRVEGDYRMNYSPGWKYNHWELKGVPIRIELGPKDLEKKQVVAVRRDTGEKISIPRDVAVKKLNELLDIIQDNLYKRASKDLADHMIVVKDWSKFSPTLEGKNVILSPFCGEVSCEDRIKADSARDDDADPGAPSMGAKSLCIPLEQPAEITNSDRCIHPKCKNKPRYYTLFGRSY